MEEPKPDMKATLAVMAFVPTFFHFRQYCGFSGSFGSQPTGIVVSLAMSLETVAWPGVDEGSAFCAYISIDMGFQQGDVYLVWCASPYR